MTPADLSDDTRNILKQVENKTGRPVEVLSDPAMPTLASVKMAKDSIPAHVLTYNPNNPEVEYHIAYQCGFILRLYDNPLEERFEFAGSGLGKEAVRGLLEEDGGVAKKLRLSKSAVKQLSDQFVNGLLVQLRSYPIGMRIDQWIRDTYPALHNPQETSINRQQRDNVRVLSPQIRQMAPSLILSGNASMNAAYALFCDRFLSMSQYVIPYRSVGFEERGRKLLDIWDAIPSDARRDRELVDAWAEELNISDWYRWVPLNPGGWSDE